ncbi:hypothetical protein EJB05_26077, partial [Eragrostis curvula]
MVTDDSQNCGCMFRIGVRVVPDSYHGARILEGMTEAFMVRDRHDYELHRSKNYKWLLAFQSQLQHPIYFGHQIRDVIGNPLEVILVDTETGLPSVPHPTLELRIELVSLKQVDWSNSRLYDWPTDELRISMPKRQCIFGDVSLTMKDDGRVTVNDLKIMGYGWDNGCHIGVRVVPGSYNGPVTIHEGMTKSFSVDNKVMKMKRSRLDVGDEVWRLEGISWGGVLHKRLTQNKVRNVKDFLMILAVKPDKLRALTQIVGDDMDDRTWSEIIRHARTCVVPGDKLYTYNTAQATIYVDSIFNLVKVELGGVEWPLQPLDEAQKVSPSSKLLQYYLSS